MISFVDSHSLQIDLWTPNNNLTDEGLHNIYFDFPQNFYELYFCTKFKQPPKQTNQTISISNQTRSLTFKSLKIKVDKTIVILFQQKKKKKIKSEKYWSQNANFSLFQSNSDLKRL